MKLPAAFFVAPLCCLTLLLPASAGAATGSWQFEPSSFDFGTRLPTEGPTPDKAFELRNTGEVSLSPSFVALSEEGGAGFKVSHNGCDHALGPGTGCTIEVTFGPRGGGHKEATLTVETPSPAVPAATAQLIGSGGEPIVVINPASVTFDPVTIPSATLLDKGSVQTITVTNSGTADLSIKEVAFKEEGLRSEAVPDFVGHGAAVGPGICGPVDPIPPRSSCGIDIEFRPQTPGTHTAELKLVDNAPGSPQVIPLVGSATQEPPVPLPPGPRLQASRPKFIEKPPLRTRSHSATFAFSADSNPTGFRCRWTRRVSFHRCSSPFHLRDLSPGRHVFSVYAIGRDGAPGPARTYHWQILP